MTLLLTLVLLLLVFGGGRLGSIGKHLGEGVRSFKRALDGKPEASPRVEVVQKPIKLLPAKGESSAKD